MQFDHYSSKHEHSLIHYLRFTSGAEGWYCEVEDLQVTRFIRKFACINSETAFQIITEHNIACSRATEAVLFQATTAHLAVDIYLALILFKIPYIRD